MNPYEKTTAFWRQKGIKTDAQLAEALNVGLISMPNLRTFTPLLMEMEEQADWS